LDSVQNGLEINTAFLDHLSVDPDGNTLTAGGSVTFGQAIDALYPIGKEMRKLYPLADDLTHKLPYMSI
jgi:hypothetical protein